MSIIFKETYPKVVSANNSHTVYFSLDASGAELTPIEAKLQPMEAHTVSHYPNYLSHDEDRYPWLPLTNNGNGIYSVQLDFPSEQRYSLKLRANGDVVY